jgi:hypothetical protein
MVLLKLLSYCTGVLFVLGESFNVPPVRDAGAAGQTVSCAARREMALEYQKWMRIPSRKTLSSATGEN